MIRNRRLDKKGRVLFLYGLEFWYAVVRIWVFDLVGGMGMAVGEMIIMSLFGGERVKATDAYVGFTFMIGSVGYEARHVSDPCIVSFSRFWFFEEEEVNVVLAIFAGGKYSTVKARSSATGSTAYRFIEISGFCSSKRESCFGDIGNSMPLTFSDVLWGL